MIYPLSSKLQIVKSRSSEMYSEKYNETKGLFTSRGKGPEPKEI
jgi:hypothetical protein